MSKDTKARDEYEARRAEIMTMLERLEEQLDCHSFLFAAEPRNWGYVGDLDRVKHLLAEINEFMEVPTTL